MHLRPSVSCVCVCAGGGVERVKLCVSECIGYSMHAHNTHQQDLTSPENKVSYNRRTHEIRKIVIRITRIIILRMAFANKPNQQKN